MNGLWTDKRKDGRKNEKTEKEIKKKHFKRASEKTRVDLIDDDGFAPLRQKKNLSGSRGRGSGSSRGTSRGRRRGKRVRK